MSNTRVKTKYKDNINYQSHSEEEEHVLYCYHNHSSDFVTFYDEDGDVQSMIFNDSSGLWDAMILLNSPFKKEWNGELKEGIEYYNEIPKIKNPMVKIIGYSTADGFIKNCLESDLEKVAREIYAEYPGEDMYYDLIKFLWVNYPDEREECKLISVVDYE